MSGLAGKHALVTGGGSGVGAAVALALAENGASVTVTGRRLEPLEALSERSDRISPSVCDATDPEAVEALFNQMKIRHGGADIVVANAGAARSMPLTKTSVDDWKAMIDVNLTGVFLAMRAGVAGMAGKDWGRIVSIASSAGLKGYAYVAAYCAAKHGVVGLTRAVALETARKGITVNAVCPGYTRTPMLERSIDNIMEKTGSSRDAAEQALLQNNPTGRFVETEEVAQAVLWLCGPHSASVTGQALSLTGGEI